MVGRVFIFCASIPEHVYAKHRDIFIDHYCNLPLGWTTCVVLFTFSKVYVYFLVETTVCYLSCFQPLVGPFCEVLLSLRGFLCPSLKACSGDRFLGVPTLSFLYYFLTLANYLVPMVSFVLSIASPFLPLLIVNFGYVAYSLICTKKSTFLSRCITFFLFSLTRCGFYSLLTWMTFGCEMFLKEPQFFRILGAIYIICSVIELIIGLFFKLYIL